MILDSRYFLVDDLLRRPYTLETPFGSSGETLWAASPQGWGFAGGVHFLHPTSASGLAPLTLHIEADDRVVVPENAVYRPSHITLDARDVPSGLQITEDKFITGDDVLVSVLHGRNAGEYSLDLAIHRTWGVPEGENELRKNTLVWVHRDGPPPDDLRQSVPPGGRIVLVFVCAFASSEAEAQKRAAFWFNNPELVQTQKQQYQKWFDVNVPLWECSDPWVTKLWYHRWYLVRKNHSKPGRGLTQQDTFSQGRWTSEANSASLPRGAASLLREVRWLKSGRIVRNFAQSLLANRDENGNFRAWYVDKILPPGESDPADPSAIYAALRAAQRVHPGAGKPWDLPELPDAPPPSETSENPPDAWEQLSRETQAQFEDGDFSRPATTNAENQKDTFAGAAWNDLLLTGVIGIVPRPDDIWEMRPQIPPLQNGGWAYFCLENLMYRNRLVTIVWDDPAHPEDAFHDGDKGLTLYVNAKRVYHQNDLAPFTVDLPPVEE